VVSVFFDITNEVKVYLSRRLNIIPGFRWMVDAPHRLRQMMGFIITPVMLFLIALGVEGRLPVISQQYAGLIPGDLLLALAWAIAISMAARHLLVPHNQWYQTRWFQGVKLGVGLFWLLLLTVPEITVTALHYGEPNIMSWGIIFSPTKLYHTAVLVVYGYLMTAVVFPVLISTSWRKPRLVVAKIVIITCLGGWAYCAIVYDNTHPRPDIKYVHVDNGWWWQRSHFWQGSPE
jgi:hypothetical protein